MSDHLRNTLLVGAGNMSIEYAKILQQMNIPFSVIGRGEKSAEKFSNETGVQVHVGGLEKHLDRTKNFKHAIVAVGVDQLASVAMTLIEHGVTSLLLEKPGGLKIEEIETVSNMAKARGASVYIAYNRRFYSSVEMAKKMIVDDGGVLSFSFEFTEWAHVIEKLPTPAIIKENWLLANSTHVIDLAFYLGGWPAELKSWITGGLAWHSKGSIFTGAGVTQDGALFSYHANWESPGRWGIELFTKHHRIVLRPLEKLQIQNHGTIKVEEVSCQSEWEEQFKPGLYRQIEAFYNGDDSLPTIQCHLEFLEDIYLPISNPVSSMK